MGTVAELEQLFAAESVRADVPTGGVVVRAGEHGGGLVRVVAGRLGLDVPHHDRVIRVAELGPGVVLGTVSVVVGGSPTATATALEPGVVEVVDRETALAVLADHPELAASMAADARAALGQDALLHALAELLDGVGGDTDADVAATARQLRVRHLRAGDLVCEQGDTSRTGYLVLAGRCAVLRDDTEVARIGRGATVGEVALLTGAARTASVVALRDTVVAELRADDLQELAATRPTVGFALLGRLTEAALATGRGADRTTRPAATIAVATTVDTMNGRVLLSRFEEALAPFGGARQLTAAVVDRDLGVPGAGASAVDDPIADRVAAHLRDQELAHAHLVLEVRDADDRWSRRALADADHLVVAVAPEPSADELRAFRAIVDAAPPMTPVTALVDHPAGTERPVGTADLLTLLGADDALHVRDGAAADIARAARLVAGRGTALVLGGGGAPGFAHLGVQQALTEAGVAVDLVVGTSIGSTMAGLLALDVPRDRWAGMVHDVFDGILDYTVPVTSLVKGERATRACEAVFDGRDIEDLWLPFRCVSTNLTHSRPVVHATGPAATAVRASVAIPGVIPPVPAGDDLLVDGGVLNNLPVDVAARDPRCGTIVAVDVAPPTGPRARADYGLSVSGVRALVATVKRGRSEFPGLTTILMRSVIVGSIAQRAASLEAADVDLLLELHVRGVGLLDFGTDVARVIEQGAELAAPLVESWLAERARG